MIIWATHTFFQNNLNATPGDPRIALTRHAPVYVKPRPMVVLYSTDSGLCCAPMFSLDNKGNWNRRQYEYIAITKEGDDWQGETEWAGVLKFRPHPQQRRPLKGRTYISLHQTLYVSTREYVETDLGYLPGDMYNRLIIALDYYQETRKRIAFKHFQEEYKNRGMRLVDEADDVREHEGREVSVQNRRMRDYRPERDDDTMVWSLVSGRKVEELISDRSRHEDWARSQREPEMLPY
ncbi:hypothetical protein E4T48_02429 [Aureobasidium sp. EXF-10727]|nr:hypothetical protein E4T48_02429 [Aureobasidium sp. EXF-10727]